MKDYILLMHSDAIDDVSAHDDVKWSEYITMLRKSGRFDGGSSIGTGECIRKNAAVTAATNDLTGYVRVQATSLDDAKRFLVGNPVYEAGGTVDIRELPRT